VRERLRGLADGSFAAKARRIRDVDATLAPIIERALTPEIDARFSNGQDVFNALPRWSAQQRAKGRGALASVVSVMAKAKADAIDIADVETLTVDERTTNDD
jgi:hypothetical protein